MSGSGPGPHHRRSASAALLAALAASAMLPAQELAEVPLATDSARAEFLAVGLDDETRRADERLAGYLNNMVPSVYFVPELGTYESVLEALVNRSRSSVFLARLTPLVYLAAESLGAELVPLASYRSRTTGDYTYRSYLVVRKEDLVTERPTAEDVVDLIASLNREGLRARFRHHSRFSTASYYLPARFFLQHRVFNTERTDRSLLAIDSRQIESESSSELVRMVARSRSLRTPEGQTQGPDGADIVAVWDGTRARFCREPQEDICRRLHFIPLDTVLPNDVLVASASMSDWTRTQVQTAITTMADREIDVGDFLRWEDIRQAHQARTALLALAREGRQVPSKITIDVRADENSRPPVLAWQQKAVEEAIELSGTEFTVWERYVHRQADFEWTLEVARDYGLKVTSRPNGFLDAEPAVQTASLDYSDQASLMEEAATFIRTRMHRILHVWPYASRPTVIRNLPLALPEAGTRLRVARIVWEDFDKHGYVTEPSDWFWAEVVQSDFDKILLDSKAFPADVPRTAVHDLELDPMSNVWFRVLIERKAKPVWDRKHVVGWGTLSVLIVSLVSHFRRRRRRDSAD